MKNHAFKFKIEIYLKEKKDMITQHDPRSYYIMCSCNRGIEFKS